MLTNVNFYDRMRTQIKDTVNETVVGKGLLSV